MTEFQRKHWQRTRRVAMWGTLGYIALIGMVAVWLMMMSTQ